MNKFNRLLAATVVLSTVVAPGAASADTTNVSTSAVTANATGNFADLGSAGSWAKDAIVQAKNLGLMKGDPDGNFRPLGTLTRQELAVILTNAMKLDASTAVTTDFSDVTASTWGSHYIAAVQKAGLMSGDGDGHFRPNDPVTREELAVVLAKALNLPVNGQGNNLAVADRNAISSWAKDAVQAVIEEGLMKGDGVNFNPKSNATRQEIAVVAVQFVKALEKAQIASVDSVADGSVTIQGVTYQVADSLAGILNAKNAEVLKGSKIKFVTDNGTINQITYLEVTNSGQAAAAGSPEFSGDLVLDGGNSTISGDLKISADYITVNNLNVTGNLVIGSELQNDFYSSNLKVSGQTEVDGGAPNTVVFDNDSLGDMQVNKQNVRVKPEGSTTVGNVTVSSNATITADAGVTIPQLTVLDGADSVEINATVTTVNVQGGQNTTIGGSGSLGTVTVSGGGNVSLSTTGTIGSVQVTNSNTKLTVAPGTKINNLQLPDGVQASDVIQNYDQVKGQITNVNGSQNPDAPATGGGGSTGGGGGGSVPTPVDHTAPTLTGVNVVDGADGYTPVTTPEVGQVIRANLTLSDGTTVGAYPVDPKVTYKWYYKGSDTVLGTTPSYTVTSDNVGKTLCVDVSYAGSAVIKTWTAANAVVEVVTGVNVVDGADGYTPVTTPEVGQVIRANITLSDGTTVGAYPVDQKATYKWYYEGSDTVLGTTPSYTVTSDNVGKTLCVDVSYAGSTVTKTWTAANAVVQVVTTADELTTALTNANAGDTLYLGADITLTSGITIDKALTLKGNNHAISGAVDIEANNVTVDGVKITALSSIQNATVGFYVNGTGVVIKNSSITGTSAGASGTNGILTVNNAGLTVEDSTISNVGAGIYLNPGSTLKATGNTISNTAAGIGSDSVDLLGGQISNNQFQNYTADGIGVSNLVLNNGATNESVATQLESNNTFTPGTGATGKVDIYSASGELLYNTNATVTSTAYTVDSTSDTITAVPYGTTLADFKAALSPATGATFKVYQADGTTEATDLKSGDKVIVTAQNGTAKVTYTVTEQIMTADELTTALTNANVGDTLYLGADITLTSGITIDKALTLKGNNHAISGAVDIEANNVTVDGVKITALSSIQNATVGFYVNGTGVVIKNSSITGTSAGASGTNGILTVNNAGLTVVDSTISNVGAGIYLNPGSTLNATGNTISNTAAGIGSDSVDLLAGQISNNKFQNYTADGIGVSNLVLNNGATNESVATQLESNNTFTPGTGATGKVDIYNASGVLLNNATVTSTAYTVDSTDETITGVAANTDVATFIGNLTAAAGATYKVYQADGKTEVSSGNIVTGMEVTVTAEDGNTKNTYSITTL